MFTLCTIVLVNGQMLASWQKKNLQFILFYTFDDLSDSCWCLELLFCSLSRPVIFGLFVEERKHYDWYSTINDISTITDLFSIKSK